MPGSKYWSKSLNAGAGCVPVGEKCRNCWALKTVARMTQNPVIQAGGGVAGPPGELVANNEWTGRVRWDVAKMKPALYREGHVVAVWWLGDLFMDNVPDIATEAQLEHTLADAKKRHAKRLAPNRYLYLSSRPQNMAKRLARWMNKVSTVKCEMQRVLETHWWGASVWDERSWRCATKELRVMPGRKWMSLEPWLKPIRFGEFCPHPWEWIVAGSETGPGARPAQTKWFEWLVEWTREHQVALFLKQLTKRGDRRLNGRTYDEFPWATS